jgi:streptomycin 6-kinase
LFEPKASTLIPHKLLTASKECALRLFAQSTTSVLLHGDLHHDNILHDGNAWVAIDPKGLIGDPAYEIAPLLCNPIDKFASLANQELKKILVQRISQLSVLVASSIRAKKRSFPGDWYTPPRLPAGQKKMDKHLTSGSI